MAKYAVSYIEVYRQNYIVEAENYEKAEEKVREAAEHYELDFDIESFDYWEVESDIGFGTKEVPETEELAGYYKDFPEPGE